MEALASEFGYYSAPPPPPPPSSIKNPDNFAVEDLLDFSHDDGASDQLATDSFTSTPPLDTSHSSDNNHHPHFTSPSHFSDSHFSGDLCLPYEDSAELEWLSNFVEESFSTEDIQKLQLISGMSALKTRPDDYSEPRYYPLGPTCTVASPSPSLTFSSEQPVPGKARSKRSRAAPGNWATCLRLLNPTQPDTPAIAKPDPKKKGESGVGLGMGLGHDGGEVRRCLHCATDKTPQWRTGPMGPKTLCNACGVRYKSGRLVPEYRPAASPTFMLAKHSNSHRKVMELRRQKELQRQQQLQQQYHHQHHQHHPQQLIHNPNGMMFDQANSDDYLIHQPIGPDFRQLI